MIDDVSIEYEGNRLVKADDTVDGPYGEGLFHFVDGADEEQEYQYDENGNMTKDLNRGIEEIKYNYLNLPSKITFTEKNAYIRNMYDANGHKFKMITYANIPLVIGRAAPAKASAVNKARAVGLILDSLVYDNPVRNKFIPDWELRGVPGQTIYDYCGNIVYKNGVQTIYREDGFTTLARMRFPEFHYYIRDHQGNIRGVTDGRGNIEQQNDYYPFGGMMASSTGGAVQPYRYTGKELVRFQGLDWLDYGARWYDPATLRWNGVDKLAEKNNSVSAYTFCHNNPVNRVDPDGMDDYIVNNMGQVILAQRTKTKYDRLFSGNKKNIVVKDKGILSQLSRGKGSKSESFSRSDMNHVFRFLADNTDVEWGVSGFKTGKGTAYVLYTSHKAGSVTPDHGGHSVMDMTFNIHSHPRKNGRNEASDSRIPGTNKFIKGSDTYFASSIIEFFRSNIKEKEIPPFWIYNARTRQRFQYDNWRLVIPNSIYTFNNQEYLF